MLFFRVCGLPRICRVVSWPTGPPEAAKANNPLADGWASLIYLVRGDLEWMTSLHKLGNHRSSTPCALCPCNSDDSMPWTDCSCAARWRKSIWTHTPASRKISPGLTCLSMTHSWLGPPSSTLCQTTCTANTWALTNTSWHQ